jgi:hypothetical protein
MIISLESHKRYQQQLKDIRELDVKASYVALDQCLKTLNINDLPELDTIKAQIRQVMKKLENCNG